MKAVSLALCLLAFVSCKTAREEQDEETPWRALYGESNRTKVHGRGTDCRLQSDGVEVCGYHCRTGSDGHVACASTPDGTCTVNAQGRAVCSSSGEPANKEARSGPAGRECLTGADGHESCGYNCKLGGDGRYYCASTPTGMCTLNGDGRWSCP